MSDNITAIANLEVQLDRLYDQLDDCSDSEVLNILAEIEELEKELKCLRLSQ